MAVYCNKEGMELAVNDAHAQMKESDCDGFGNTSRAISP